MLNIAVLISGSGTNLQTIIDGCKNNEINGKIKIVISNNKEAYGLTRAKNNNIKAVYEKDETKIIELLKKENIDLIVLAGYLKIVTKNFVNEFKNKIINIHPSLIPSFCGKGYYGEIVHQKVLEYGVKITGATVHFVDEGADTGPVIIQKSVIVKDNDTLETLKKRVLHVEHEILKEAVKLFCDKKLKLKGRRVFINE
ncbi:phosphoribosylglycinamide formyltransferase [Tepidibacter formicigenes]|jgi:phosphoribosylglycinamide formyltransferase-1|uniref:Phosphoribosylglycinamide formyltransferase n=1 Tax=Tepidibacter formicigenes DSM 15518 TaxID=1123349 RepID=A0A1M6NDT7_9FIRM|nr:phosphoribosylglycinamide formyltransferase [Tepidibacter formicigenes]SHJ93877.1 phosphoribosylglycinamide formyltransferase-1 [Tepidibacter formicigenes DSM 15518]